MHRAAVQLYLMIPVSLLQLLPEFGCLMSPVHELALLDNTSPPLLCKLIGCLHRSLPQALALVLSSLQRNIQQLSLPLQCLRRIDTAGPGSGARFAYKYADTKWTP